MVGVSRIICNLETLNICPLALVAGQFNQNGKNVKFQYVADIFFCRKKAEILCFDVKLKILKNDVGMAPSRGSFTN